MLCITTVSYSDDVNESELKGVLLLKLPLFIEWPIDAFKNEKNLFSIGVFGNSEITKALKSFEGDTIKGKKIIIRSFNKISDIKQCHIVYICPTDIETIKKILKNYKGKPILFVGNQENFAKIGGIINFYKQEDRIKFEINVDNSNFAGLKISSKLLKLSKIIYNE